MNDSDNIYDLLLQEIMPNYLVIDEDFKIIYNNVNIQGFFTMTKESPALDLLNMISPELSIIIQKAVNQALEETSALKLDAVEIEGPGDPDRIVDLIIKPVINKKLTKKAVIIEIHSRKDESPINKDSSSSKESRLKQELEETKINLKQLETQLEASRKELQSTYEELQSSNEELQSSNEELQSLNEELYSVNSELQERMKELAQLNEECNQLIEGAKLGMVVLDENTTVLKYTRTAKSLFDIKDEDVGKNIFSLNKKFRFSQLPKFLNDGFKTNSIDEAEIKTDDGDHFTMRRLPLNNRLLLLFLDINQVKDINQLYKSIFENSNDFVTIFDQDNKIKLVNKLASESWHQENIIGASILDYIPEDKQKKEVAINLKKMFTEGRSYEYYLKTQDLTGKRFIFFCKTHLIRQTKASMGVLMSRDVTLPKQRNYILNHLTNNIADIILSIDDNGNIVSLSSREHINFSAFSEHYTKWHLVLGFYKEDKKTRLSDPENPLLTACKGIETRNYKLHVKHNETGEIFHLTGDFFPLKEEGVLDGAIAYLYKL